MNDDYIYKVNLNKGINANKKKITKLTNKCKS